MSLWQQNDEQSGTPKAASVTDVHFRINCERLPVDHAYALSEAVLAAAPWLADLPHAGVQAVHVAASQNGWERPDIASEDLILSRRTRLKIRVDSVQADRLIECLCGKNLEVHGNPLQIINAQQRALTPASTLFSRYTVFDQQLPARIGPLADPDDENRFIDAVIDSCRQLGFQPSKLLCGKSHLLATGQAPLLCRSVLLADVPPEHSLKLQEMGLGAMRRMGCGILLPHKDTGAVHQLQE